MIDTEGKQFVDGAVLFKMKDEQGLPLDMQVGVLFDLGFGISWPGFIDAARRAGWYDFQIHDQIEHALQDCGSCSRDYISGVLERVKLYVLKHPQTR